MVVSLSTDTIFNVIIIGTIFIVVVLLISVGFANPSDWMYIVQNIYGTISVYIQSMLKGAIR
jgi:hypothetical protein